MSNDTLWELFNFDRPEREERPALPVEWQGTAIERPDGPQDPFGELNSLTHVQPER